MHGLTATQVSRYSRQLLVQQVGVHGQERFLASRVLVVGAGALGCAVLPYLVCAGVGHVTLVDFDLVEEANLPRQILYRESDVGLSKAECAAVRLKELNSKVNVVARNIEFSVDEAEELVAAHDVVVDASDNLHTRYLINDACILGGKPLVSGSALGLEGQVTVYNYDGGPCFRCIHPEPSGSEMHRSCADNGVMGFVPGLIGSLQAAEVLKIIGRFGTPLSRKMNLYSALEGGFYAVNLPSKRACCRVCGTDKSITSLAASKLWGESRHLRLGNSRTCISSAATLSSAIIPVISCADYAALRKKGREGVLLDVRQPAQFAIFRLEGAVNIPHPLLETKEGIEKVRGLLAHPEDPIYCFCRRGVDSRRAVELLLQGGLPGARDVEGGALAWRRDVDSNFPAF